MRLRERITYMFTLLTLRHPILGEIYTRIQQLLLILGKKKTIRIIDRFKKERD